MVSFEELGNISCKAFVLLLEGEGGERVRKEGENKTKQNKTKQKNKPSYYRKGQGTELSDFSSKLPKFHSLPHFPVDFLVNVTNGYSFFKERKINKNK